LTTAKSVGFDSFNALLEAQVHDGKNTLKGTFTNLANSGRNSEILRCSQTTHNFPQVHEERAGPCETSSSEGSNVRVGKCGTGDFDHRVREIETCQKLASEEEFIGNIGEI
jgi:hypothetical protein